MLGRGVRLRAVAMLAVLACAVFTAVGCGDDSGGGEEGSRRRSRSG